MRRADVPRDALKRLYVQERRSAYDAAKELGVKPNVVYRRLREYGIPIRASRVDIPKNTLERLYLEERKTAADIAKELGVTPHVVYHRLREYGIKRSRRIDLPVKVLEQKYVTEKKSAAEIAVELGVNAGLVLANLHRAGIPVRPTNNKPRVPISKEDLIRMYQNEGLTMADIGRKLGCDQSLIWRRLKTYGIPRRNSNTRSNTIISRGALQRMYVDERKSAAMIGRELGYSGETVLNRLKKYGFKIRGTKLKNVVTAEDLQRLYVDEGRTMREIAGMYGCHVATMHSYRRKFAIPKRRDYSSKHYARHRKLRSEGERLFAAMKEMLGGRCSACGRDSGTLVIHHMCYLPDDVIAENYRQSKRYLYHIDLYPLVRGNPGRFLLLCTGCHSKVGLLYEFPPDARARMLDTVRVMAGMRRDNPTKYADLVNA